MKRSFGYKHIVVGVAVALALTGCANAKTKTDPAPSGTTHGAKPNDGAPAAKQLTIKTYYADDNLDKLIEREATITFASDSDKYKAALNALKTSPDASLSSLSKGIDYRSAAFKDGQVVVDLAIAAEGRLGSPGEQLLVESIRKSLFQFAEVQSIDVLVEGKQTESLMGHVSLPHPIKRN
ncbi:GerMN domain-containing protein [Paenibacillus flagellatus]|uniref:GerMN domain-containing protein n=1 Tax=Paenibacillus flagellatus TaxID=2211139 RepID=A0A2V5KJN2_9BACL|nr:GerMN domain-containing protein [Paenibacillus flagellatus]PYI54840.1 hypothetical protein DLM86_09820 [Paenibacillus flagellatus]